MSARPPGFAAAAALAVAAFTSSCTVGPDYERPEAGAPASFATPLEEGLVPAAPEVASWWRSFGDPVLESLVLRAVAANRDVREARARVREARALRGEAEADFYPAIDARASYDRFRRSENSFAGGTGAGSFSPDVEDDLFEAGFDASWEIDVFGGTRRAVEAAEADEGAAEDGLRDALVTLLAELGLNAVELRGLQRRIAIAESNIRAQTDTLSITRSRFAAGLATELDVARAEALLASTRSDVPSLDAARLRAIHRLSVLCGQEPGSLRAELEASAPIPVPPPEIPVGLPSELLRRRPDVRRAERELAAATARIGVATADLYPKFSLTGSLGLSSLDQSEFLDASSRFWSVGGGVLWPVFEGGRLRARVAAAGAIQEQALARYEASVLRSLEETENALVTHARERARGRVLHEAVEANRRSVALANDLYRSGLADFLDVLAAERELYVTEDRLAESDRLVASNLVALYKALGGGWEEIVPAEPSGM